MKILPKLIEKIDLEQKRVARSKQASQSGQALLIILLVMSVALTVVLSTVSRSVTDLSITTYEEDSSRAFSAAEAGIEEALLKQPDTGFPGIVDGNIYNVEIVEDPLHGARTVFPTPLSAGEVATFWFVEVKPDGDLHCENGDCVTAKKIQNLCWGNDPDPSKKAEWPAAELSIYYDWDDNPNDDDGIGVGDAVGVALDGSGNGVGSGGDFKHVKVARSTFDLNTERAIQNKFDGYMHTGGGGCNIPTHTGDSVHLGFRTRQIKFGESASPGTNLKIPDGCLGKPGCLIMAKVKLFYSNKPERVGIDLIGSDLPPQGITIESTGESGETERKVSVEQTHPVPPSIFESALFGVNNISF